LEPVFKIGICQLKVVQEKGENLQKAREMIILAARQGAQVVILPEMFNCPYQTHLFPEYAESFPDGPSIKMLAEAARMQKVYVVGGSFPERAGDCVYNTSFTFGPDGKLLGRHRKIHLFDVDLPGGIKVRESATLSAGNQVTILQTEFCPLGVAICYDIRFPELFRLMALAGSRLIIVPAAFNLTTGPAHWEITFRVRAVDNQVYVAGASPARDYSAGYITYGHSLVVDPWGEIVAQASEEEKIIYAEIDLNKIKKVRNELPLLKHRCTDLEQLTFETRIRTKPD
jgi:predicted amidohydrolase